MKRLLPLALIFISLSMFSQKADTTKSKIPFTGYVCASMPMSNSNHNFASSSFASVEGGFCYSNMQFGLALGRGSLAGFKMGEQDNLQNYYYEVMMYPSFPLGILTGNLIMGYGGFFDSKIMFIEYGAGASYSLNKKVSFGMSCFNWNSVNFISPGITFNF